MAKESENIIINKEPESAEEAQKELEELNQRILKMLRQRTSLVAYVFLILAIFTLAIVLLKGDLSNWFLWVIFYLSIIIFIILFSLRTKIKISWHWRHPVLLAGSEFYNYMAERVKFLEEWIKRN